METLATCKKISALLVAKADGDYAEIAGKLDDVEKKEAPYHHDRQSKFYVAALHAQTTLAKALVKYECAIAFDDRIGKSRQLRGIEETVTALIRFKPL